MLYILMKIITTIRAMNSISTLRSSIFLLIFLPQNPPRIPPDAIKTKRKMENAGTVDVKIEFKRLVIWENKIMYKEF